MLFWTVIIGVGTVLLVAGTAFLVIFAFRQKRAESLLLAKLEPSKPEVAKPEILDPKNCFITVFIERQHPKGLGHIHPTKKEVRCEFTADNGLGIEDCSLLSVSIELSLKNRRCIVNEEKHSFATPLPKPILAHQAESIKVYGICEPSLQIDEKAVAGKITARFNNGESKSINTIFTIEERLTIDRRVGTFQNPFL
ncbi:MAG: hypothetical protein ABR913_05585 [Sedimentisphaerales bacterium]|jgi:hypothetical protein